jgi:hypothetical protein
VQTNAHRENHKMIALSVPEIDVLKNYIVYQKSLVFYLSFEQVIEEEQDQQKLMMAFLLSCVVGEAARNRISYRATPVSSCSE